MMMMIMMITKVIVRDRTSSVRYCKTVTVGTGVMSCSRE